MSQPANQSSAFFVSGGTLKPNAPSYVERTADREFFERLSAGDFCYILTSRQMGKSSLMARTAMKLREAGALTAIIDLSGIGEGAKESDSAASWYFGMARTIARELGLKAELKNWWQERDKLPEQLRLAEFLEDLVLGATSQRVVIFVDEIDATLRLPFTDDFFAGIRACYNARANKPAFERLTFALLGVASPSELIKDTSSTPFNIGQRIELADFTLDEARPLATGFPLAAEEAARVLERVLHWTGGQPYLTQKLCLELSRRFSSAGWQPAVSPTGSRRTVPTLATPVDCQSATQQTASLRYDVSRPVQSDEARNRAPGNSPTAQSDSDLARCVDELVQELLFSPEGSRDEVHFKYIRDRLRQDPHARRVLLTYRNVLDGGRVPDNPQSLIHNALKLAGLVQRAADGHLEIRNPIYQRVFDQSWVRQEMAKDHTRLRTFAVGALVILLVVVPVGFWLKSGSEETRAKDRVQALLAARPEAVPDALANLQPLQRRALPLLLAAFTNASAGSPAQLQAAFGLAALGDIRVPFLVESAAQGPPGQCMNLVRALQPHQNAALAQIQQAIPHTQVPAARARLATLALFLSEPDLQQLRDETGNPIIDEMGNSIAVRVGAQPWGDTRPLEALTLRNANPTNRTTIIHGYREWPGDPIQLAAILQTSRTNSGLADFRSALCAALALVEWKTLAAPEQTALVKTLRELYTEAPDGGTHSAAACALTRWDQALPEIPAATNQPPADRDWFVNGQGMTMIRIPAGEFRMGYAGSETNFPTTRIHAGNFRGDTNFLGAQPAHSVKLSKDFFISDRKVTVALFRQFTNDVASDTSIPALERLSDWAGMNSKFNPTNDYPVRLVSWYDAVKFCNWLSRQERRTSCYRAVNSTKWVCDFRANGYRLPTEAEWEYACRAVSESRFMFGDDEELLTEYAGYSLSGRTELAGKKLPNLWGLFNLHDEIWEWCQDWLGSYREGAVADPTGPPVGSRRVFRGGLAYGADVGFVSSAVRRSYPPDDRSDALGFRCVCGVVGSAAR